MEDSKFKYITDLVIDNVEGGYYHPNMLKDGRVHDPHGYLSAGPGHAASGETMFGEDRINGAGLRTLNSSAWDRFWQIIDLADAKDKWGYNFKGGLAFGPQLKEVLPLFMKPEYEHHASKYLSLESQQFINQDNRIAFHFVYATWNGEGFFEQFAHIFNEAVKAGEKDLDHLARVAADSRLHSKNILIAKGGVNCELVMEKIKHFN